MKQDQENIPIHQLDSQMILSIERIEECDPINFSGTHRHNFYELLFFTKVSEGDCHFIDFVEYIIKPETFYIVLPGQVYKMDYHSQRGFMIAIYPDYFVSTKRLFSSLFSPTEITLNPIDKKQAAQLIHLILDEYEHTQRDILLRSFLDSLTLILEISSQPSDERKIGDNRVQVFLSLVEEFYKTNRDVTFYAQKMAIGEKTLNRFCTKYLGSSPKQIILNRLLLEAQRKIATTELSFQEIAIELGFKEPTYFTRFFKQQSGKTPELFKSNLTIK